MQLKYVGDLAKVSKHGVSFDHSHPDKYTYLQAAAELLEALSYGASETTKHLYKTKAKELSPVELLDFLKKYVKNIEEVFDAREEKAAQYVDDLIQRVNENESLTDFERVAWLGNIKLMKDYFFQYVANASVYAASLNALCDEIDSGKIKEVSVPMLKNYGIVINDLVEVLENRKVPINSEVTIEDVRGELIGTLRITHT